MKLFGLEIKQTKKKPTTKKKSGTKRKTPTVSRVKKADIRQKHGKGVDW